MASKQNQLVQTLLDQNQQLNATQLANSLGVSVRTVHNYINAVNAQYQDAIVSTPTGYRIAPAMAQQMLHQSPNDIPQNAQDRCTYILNRLVQKGGSLNLYDLCEEIYISATTFHSLMGKMRRLTREYDLSLAVSGDTVTLTGSERNKRRLLSGLLYHESASAFTSTDSLQAAFPSIDIEKIRADVMDVLNENHYFINDYSLLNLLLHIAIAINRVQNGCVYTEAPSTMHPLDPQNERLAQELRGQSRFLRHHESTSNQDSVQHLSNAAFERQENCKSYFSHTFVQSVVVVQDVLHEQIYFLARMLQRIAYDYFYFRRNYQ